MSIEIFDILARSSDTRIAPLSLALDLPLCDMPLNSWAYRRSLTYSFFFAVIVKYLNGYSNLYSLVSTRICRSLRR